MYVAQEDNMQTLINNFYSSVYSRWRINEEKAGKDIVGEEYEIMREAFWKQNGFVPSKGTIAGYDADQVIRDPSGKIVVIEEDKAHYVDSCFLDRFAMNAARVIQHYIDSDMEDEMPYIVLSSMTKYNLFEDKFAKNKNLFSDKIQSIMTEKVKYFPICKHDRVSAKKYFKGLLIQFLKLGSLKSEKYVALILETE